MALRFREQELLLSQLVGNVRNKSTASYKKEEMLTKTVTFEAEELAQAEANVENRKEAKATSPRSIEYARLGSARRSFVRQTMAVHSLKAEKVARMTRTRVSMHRMPPSETVKGLRGFVRDMIASTWFSVFITGLIALNVILLGIEVDVSASVLDVNDVPAWFGVSNLVLAARAAACAQLQFVLSASILYQILIGYTYKTCYIYIYIIFIADLSSLSY